MQVRDITSNPDWHVAMDLSVPVLAVLDADSNEVSTQARAEAFAPASPAV